MPSGNWNGLMWIPGYRRRQEIRVKGIHLWVETEILKKSYNLSPKDRFLGSKEECLCLSEAQKTRSH